MKNILLLLFAFMGADLAAMEFGRTDLPQTPSNALHEAVKNNDKELVQQLIAQGADVNANEPGLKGNVPLCLAIDNNNVEIMELLLKAGAHVDAVVFYENTGWWDRGDTLLMRATSDGQIEAVKLLLNYHANPLISNNRGKTVFDILHRMLGLDRVAAYQRAAHIKNYTTILDLCLCSEHTVKDYKNRYKQILLIQRSTAHPALPKDMLNHILWIVTGLLCSQVQNFKP